MKRKIDAKRIVILAAVAVLFVGVVGFQGYRYVLGPMFSGGAAVASQPPRRRAGPSRAPQSPPDRAVRQNNQNDPPAALPASYAPPPRLPNYELDEVLLLDPFRASERGQKNGAQAAESSNSAPSAAARQAALSLRQAALSLRQAGVEAVIQSESGNAALVEGEIVRVGDRLGEWTVRRIEPDGIVVSLDPAE